MLVTSSPVVPPGTTLYAARIADGYTPVAADGLTHKGTRCQVRNQLATVAGHANEITELELVKVTKSGGLLPGRPWSINVSGEAFDYADGTSDYDAVLPDPELDSTVSVAENDLCYVVRSGVAKSRTLAAGDGTGFAPGTLAEHETSGTSGSDVGVKSASSLSKATIGLVLNTLAGSTAGTVYVRVNKKR